MKDGIEMDPEMAKIFHQSKAVSSKSISIEEVKLMLIFNYSFKGNVSKLIKIREQEETYEKIVRGRKAGGK